MSDIITRKGSVAFVNIGGKPTRITTVRTDWKATAKVRLREMRRLRYQLRWAWAKLGCRCAFDEGHNKITEDSHCPIHGWYNDLEGSANPEGWENVKP